MTREARQLPDAELDGCAIDWSDDPGLDDDGVDAFVLFADVDRDDPDAVEARRREWAELADAGALTPPAAAGDVARSDAYEPDLAVLLAGGSPHRPELVEPDVDELAAGGSPAGPGDDPDTWDRGR